MLAGTFNFGVTPKCPVALHTVEIAVGRNLWNCCNLLSAISVW